MTFLNSIAGGPIRLLKTVRRSALSLRHDPL
jgi:hypothetical protein